MGEETTMNEMLAFPWMCISCQEQNRGEPAKRHPFGPVCTGCWVKAKELAYEEMTGLQ